ncbi:hypothetical protein SK128_018199 [Halocaridina rubra]|uniref:Uncharacterized protein n=1 Tax=Halocaridina rubra TaxID=373956 RepID=A0AAN8WZS8_HALRR
MILRLVFWFHTGCGASLPLGTSTALAECVITDAPVAPQPPIGQYPRREIGKDRKGGMNVDSHLKVRNEWLSKDSKNDENADSGFDKRLKMRSEWLSNTYTSQDIKSKASGSNKCYSDRDTFFMEKSGSPDKNIKPDVVKSGECSNMCDTSDQCNDNRCSNQNGVNECGEVISDARTSNNMLYGVTNPCIIPSSISKVSVNSDLVINRDQELNQSKPINVTCSMTKKNKYLQQKSSLSSAESKSNQEQRTCTLKCSNSTEHINEENSICSKMRIENSSSPKNVECEIETVGIGETDLKGDIMTNGTIITNGWPESQAKLGSDVSDDLCIEKGSLDFPEKQESAKGNEITVENLVGEKKGSKVSKFVRMFNKKEASEGGERSSVKRNQNNVLRLCMQVQSPSLDDEYYLDCVEKKGEKDSVKSEPLIDGSYRDLESSIDTGHNGNHTSSSFPEAEAASYKSLDIDRENTIANKKNETSGSHSEIKGNLSLMRNICGRRSFDRPQRLKNPPKRSHTLEESGNSTVIQARSSKTLPATPTSNDPKTISDSGTSHPFYKRFYSHCMILPMRKKKKENSKNLTSLKGLDIVVDTSQRGANDIVNLNSELVPERPVIDKISESESFDSPKKLPVIDDLLAEIMENVTIMEQEMEEDELKRRSIIFSATFEPVDPQARTVENAIKVKETAEETGDEDTAYNSLDTSNWSSAPCSSNSPTPVYAYIICLPLNLTELLVPFA